MADDRQSGHQHERAGSARAPLRDHGAQGGSVAPGDARHRAHPAQARRRDASSGAEVEVGYLHRGFEKECESGLYYQAFPYTDRLNYVSPMINNVGYALACEKLFGIEVPERCQYLRIIAQRGVAHVRPLHLPRRLRAGARRVHGVPLRRRGARAGVGHPSTRCAAPASPATTCASAASRPTSAPSSGPSCTRSSRKIAKLRKDFEDLLLSNPIFLERMEDTGSFSPRRS